MKEHFLIKVLEWASERTEGFTYGELIDRFGFKREWEIKYLESCFRIAVENEERSRKLNSPLLLETIFFVTKHGSNTFKDSSFTYTLTTDALFKFIDYEELKHARNTATEARKFSKESIEFARKSIRLAICAMIASVVIPFIISVYITQSVKLDYTQLEDIKNLLIQQNQ